MSKTFSLGAILTITTGKLLVPDIGPVYKILGYMTGDTLFTHQLPRAGRFCAEPILEQHPQLREVTGDDITTENWTQKVADLKVKYGKVLPIEPLAPGTWEHINPVTELVEMRNGT